MEQKRNIIMITDGDEYAKRAVEHAAKEIGESTAFQLPMEIQQKWMDLN